MTGGEKTRQRGCPNRAAPFCFARRLEPKPRMTYSVTEEGESKP